MSGYGEDEVADILERALARGDDLRLTHDELEEIASEVGVSSAQLRQAVADFQADRARRSDLLAAQQAVALRKRRARRRWLQRLLTFLVVSGTLALFDAMSPPMSWWYYPTIAWGMVVALSGSRLLLFDEEDEVQRELRRIEKKRARARKRAARASRRSRDRSDALEAAIERGIALLVDKAAEKLEALGSSAPSDTEFGRYVARRRGVPTRVGTAPAAPRARVADRGAGTEPVEVVAHDDADEAAR